MQELLYVRILKGIFIIFIILTRFNLIPRSYPKFCCNIIIDLMKVRMHIIDAGILVTINVRVQVGDLT